MPSPIIVSGFLYCGASKLTGMLRAGGLRLAGDAQEPAYELAEAMPTIEAMRHDTFAEMQGWTTAAPAARRIDAAWWSKADGEVVKVVYPHLVEIPRGKYRAVWCDPADERRRAILFSRHFELTHYHVDLANAYFVDRRPVARHALEQAGATILTVNNAETTGGHERCREVCKRVADHLEVPLDIDAMVAWAASVITGPIGDGVLLNGPEARARAVEQLAAQPIGTHVLFIPPR